MTRLLISNLKGVGRDTFELERDTLKIVYRQLSRDAESVSRRSALNALVKSIAAQQMEPQTLLPFIENDPSASIVKHAAISYLKLTTASIDEPFSALQDLLFLLQNPFVETRGLILAALVGLGDRQVCATLRPNQTQWDINTLQKFAISVEVENLHRTTLDTCLIWLKEVLVQAPFNPHLESHVSLIASAVSRMVMQTGSRPVLDDCGLCLEHPPTTHSLDSFSQSYDEVIRTLSPLLTSLSYAENPDVLRMREILQNPEKIPSLERPSRSTLPQDSQIRLLSY